MHRSRRGLPIGAVKGKGLDSVVGSWGGWSPPSAGAQGRMFLGNIEVFWASGLGENGDAFEFEQVQCINDVEVYPSVRSKARVSGQ